MKKVDEFASEIISTSYAYVDWEECHFKIKSETTTELVISYVSLNFPKS